MNYSNLPIKTITVVMKNESGELAREKITIATNRQWQIPLQSVLRKARMLNMPVSSGDTFAIDRIEDEPWLALNETTGTIDKVL